MNIRNRALAVVAAMAMAATAQDNLATWWKYKTVTINTKPLALAGEVTKFPVLVRLNETNAADVFSGAKSDGRDIRVAKANGTTQVPFEIESWDAAGKTAAIWVLADTIKANDSAVALRIYFGKDGVTSASNPAAVFDTANGFVGVWHMAAGDTVRDATGNGHHAIVSGTVGADSGIMGPARRFDGTATNHLVVPNSATGKLNFPASTDYTLSAWVFSDSITTASNNGHGIVNKGNHQWNMGIYGSGSAATGKHYDIMTRGNGGYNNAVTDAAGNAFTAADGRGGWHLVTGTWKGSAAADTARIYIDGQLKNTKGFGNIADSGQGRNLTFDVRIGALGNTGVPNSVERGFIGRIDEVVVANVLRDSNWIKLAFETQKQGASVLTLGATANAGGPAPAPEPIVEDYATWSQHATVYLNTQNTGAGVSSVVTKFPVLVRLDSSNFNAGFGQAANNGADIRFTKANNTTRLEYEIERWDATAKKAEIWVLVDTIKGTAVDSIRMHWGKNGAVSLSNGAAVFDSANGFVAVYHMNGNAGEVSSVGDTLQNAAMTGNVGSVAGIVGLARSFNGENTNYLMVPNSDSGKLNFASNSNYTLSAWTYLTEESIDNRGIFNKGNDQWLIGIYGNAEEKTYDIMTRGNNGYNQATTDGITTSDGQEVWRLVTGVWKGEGDVGDVGEIYINGTLVNTAEFGDINPTGQGRNLTRNVYIGVLAEGNNLTRPFSGRIDEVIASNVARSAAWIKLTYENQKADQKFVTIGQRPVSVKSAVAASAAKASLVSQNVGGNVQFSLQGVEHARATLSLVDVYGRTVWTGSFVNGALSWNGRLANGSQAATGIYLARVNVRDAQGKTITVLDRRVPYTR